MVTVRGVWVPSPGPLNACSQRPSRVKAMLPRPAPLFAAVSARGAALAAVVGHPGKGVLALYEMYPRVGLFRTVCALSIGAMRKAWKPLPLYWVLFCPDGRKSSTRTSHV